MSDEMFVGLMAVGAAMILVGVVMGNRAPRTHTQSCGMSGLLIVLGLVLVIIPPASVVIALLAYYW